MGLLVSHYGRNFYVISVALDLENEMHLADTVLGDAVPLDQLVCSLWIPEQKMAFYSIFYVNIEDRIRNYSEHNVFDHLHLSSLFNNSCVYSNHSKEFMLTILN